MRGLCKALKALYKCSPFYWYWWLPASAFFLSFEQRHLKRTSDRLAEERTYETESLLSAATSFSRHAVKQTLSETRICRQSPNTKTVIWLKFSFMERNERILVWGRLHRMVTNWRDHRCASNVTTRAYQAASQAAVKVTKRKTHYLAEIREPSNFATALMCALTCCFAKI